MAGGLAAAVPAALFAGAAGTALHRHQLFFDDGAFPWGALAALVLLGSVQHLLAAAFRSIVAPAVTGVLCYALVGWLSVLEPGKRVVAGDLAGNLWAYGSVVVTVLMLAWCRTYRQRTVPQAQQTAPD
jgi:hypothetical protein